MAKVCKPKQNINRKEIRREHCQVNFATKELNVVAAKAPNTIKFIEQMLVKTVLRFLVKNFSAQSYNKKFVFFIEKKDMSKIWSINASFGSMPHSVPGNTNAIQDFDFKT